MESQSGKSEEWTRWDKVKYEVDMGYALKGSRLPDIRKLIEGIPTYGVGCLKCGKLHRFSELLKNCPNCSSTDYNFEGSLSQVIISCGRCGQEILQSVKCECSCVNLLNGSTLLKPKSGCFIATATYGSLLAPEVIVFRCFRDEVLLTSQLGAGCVKLYYLASPPLARLISKSKFLRAVTRRLLLDPFLRLLKSRYHL